MGFTVVPVLTFFYQIFVTKISFLNKVQHLGNACFGLAEIIRRDLTLTQEGHKQIHPKVKSLLGEMNVKSLAMKSCQMGNWEACNMYSVLSLEGLFGVKKDIKLENRKIAHNFKVLDSYLLI